MKIVNNGARLGQVNRPLFNHTHRFGLQECNVQSDTDVPRATPPFNIPIMFLSLMTLAFTLAPQSPAALSLSRSSLRVPEDPEAGLEAWAL